MNDALHTVLSRLGARGSGPRWQVRCPAHDDRKPSLSITAGDKHPVVLKCRAGCSSEDILSALGLTWEDLCRDSHRPCDHVAVPRARSHTASRPKPQKVYGSPDLVYAWMGAYSRKWEYVDRDGKLRGVIYRWDGRDGKAIRPVTRAGEGWAAGGMEIPRPLYREHALAQDRGLVIVTEGEKAADALVGLGYEATTSPHGSQSAHKADWSILGDRNIVILPDNDKAGRDYAESVAAILCGLGCRVWIGALPGLPPKGDAHDWVQAGGGRAEMEHFFGQVMAESPWRLGQENGAASEVGREPTTVTVGRHSYRFGERCMHDIAAKKEDESSVSVEFAYHVDPTAIYRQIDGEDHGVQFCYRTRGGEERVGTLSAAAFTSKNSAREYVARLQKLGVHIKTFQGDVFAEAMGRWSDQEGLPLTTLVRSPGWFEQDGQRVYVNGTRVFGADWAPDQSQVSISRRSGRKGTLGAWQAQAGALFDTPGLVAALGISLAGPLVGLLGMVPFGLHLAGYSSHGKTTALRVAASVWGDPNECMQSWDSTLRALESLADIANGACLAMDEIKRFRGDEDALSAAIHGLCSQQGRARLRADGSPALQRRWQNTLLSTGEVRVRDLLGAKFQGGHGVRLIDLWVEPGDLTRSAKHADDLRQMCNENHGVLSDAWVELLMQVDPAEICGLQDKWAQRGVGERNEEQRIAMNVGLVMAALDYAVRVALLPATVDLEGCHAWLLKASSQAEEKSQSDEKDPNLRALAHLQRLRATQPYRFPSSTQTEGARDVVAYRVSTGPDSDELWTTADMLRDAGFAKNLGISVRHWLKWCMEKKLVVKGGRARLAGLQRRWLIFCDTSQDCDGNDDDTSHQKHE